VLPPASVSEGPQQDQQHMEVRNERQEDKQLAGNFDLSIEQPNF
jgi:hypothetical protein